MKKKVEHPEIIIRYLEGRIDIQTNWTADQVEDFAQVLASVVTSDLSEEIFRTAVEKANESEAEIFGQVVKIYLEESRNEAMEDEPLIRASEGIHHLLHMYHGHGHD